LLESLPADTQRQARVAYQLFQQNPRHPGLQFKRVSAADPSLYSARVGDHYRVIGKLKGDTIIWDWIGTHEAYNRLVGGR
jgi:mRNA-degrading endonuclease RelE of RelBE toxin-antitoxin system